MALSITSPYKTGKVVANAQWLLAGNNVYKQKFYNGVKDSTYGPLMAAATYRAKYWFGYPKPDNVYDQRLAQYLQGWRKPGPIMRALRAKRLAAIKKQAEKEAAGKTKQQRALALAKTFLGYREATGNVTQFGRWYGLNGNPWCAMFCSFVANKVGSKFHYSYVPSVVADARSNRNGLFVTNHPKPGDFVCYDWQSDGTFDHIGIFEQWLSQTVGSFKTVEGNTLPEGGTGDQSNGGGTYERVRYTTGAGRVVFVRWK